MRRHGRGFHASFGSWELRTARRSPGRCDLRPPAMEEAGGRLGHTPVRTDQPGLLRLSFAFPHAPALPAPGREHPRPARHAGDPPANPPNRHPPRC